jgi:putative flippase GtrA
MYWRDFAPAEKIMSLKVRINSIYNSHKRTFLAFLSVGIMTAIFYFSLFNIFWKYFDLNYNIAVSIAYIIAITFYFFANRHFTFKTSGQLNNQLAKFLAMIISNYLITMIVVNMTVKLLLLPPYIGVFFAIACTTVANYFTARFWVFKTKIQKEI